MKREEIIKLNEKAKKLLKQAREILDKDEITAEDEAKYEELMSKYDELDSKIKREIQLMEALDHNEERLDALNRGEPDPDDDTTDNPDDDQQRGDPSRRPHEVERGIRRLQGEDVPINAEERNFLAYLVPRDVRERLLETDEHRESYAQWRRAALEVGNDAAGGALVPEGFMPELVRQMKAFGPMGDPGVTRVLTTMSGNPLPWPVVDDTANKGKKIGENVAVGEAPIPAFSQVIFNAYKYTTEALKIPQELIEDSYFLENGLLMLIAELLGERLGRTRNEVLTSGDGNDDPNGIVTAVPVGVTTATNAGILADEIIDVEHSVDPAYRRGTMLCWMFNDNTFKSVRKLKDGDGNYLWNAKDIRAGTPETISGHKFEINQDMDDFGTDGKHPIVFGNFAKYVVRKVKGIRMRLLTERYADADQVAYLGYQRLDGDCIDRRALRKVATS